MTRPSPVMLGYLQRAVRHEFAAAQQFTLQAVVARTLGEAALRLSARAWAAEELRACPAVCGRAGRSRAAFGVGPVASLPVGGSVVEVIRQARMTEAAAVRLYRDAERTCQGSSRCGSYSSRSAERRRRIMRILHGDFDRPGHSLSEIVQPGGVAMAATLALPEGWRSVPSPPSLFRRFQFDCYRDTRAFLERLAPCPKRRACIPTWALARPMSM